MFYIFVNSTPKHVFTSSDLSQPWERTTVVTDPAVDYVQRLRDRPGRDIGVHGSIRLAGSLLAADLVDRLELVVAPGIAGHGRRLFEPTGRPHRLNLLKVSGSTTGTVFLTYGRPSPSDPVR